MNFARISGRVRVPLGFVLGIVFVIFGRPDPRLLPAGLALAMCGLVVRAWAAGHIDKNSNLSVSGPYAHVRNPLYVGSFLLATGFAIACGIWFVLTVWAFFLIVYAPTIREERTRMEGLFPEHYPAYAANVPLLIPRPIPWIGELNGQLVQRRFSPGLYMRNAEWKAALGYAAGAAWLVLRLKLRL